MNITTFNRNPAKRIRFKMSIFSMILVVTMAMTFIPIVGWTGVKADAAYVDQTFTIKVPDGVYSGKTIDAITSNTSRAGYYMISASDGTVMIDSANVQTSSKNAVFKVSSIDSGDDADFEIKGEYSSRSGDAADRASEDNNYTYTEKVYGDGYNASQGSYIYSNNLGKICVGNVFFTKPGNYSITLEDMSSGDHELVTLNIDANYTKSTDTQTGEGKVSFTKNPTIEKVVSDIGRDGTVVGTKVSSDSRSDVKYVNGVYYLNYGNGSNTYILKFPLYDNYGIRVYDWVHTLCEVTNIKIDPRGTGIEFSDNIFDSERKLSEYEFSSDTSKKLKSNDEDDTPYYYSADENHNSGSNAWEWHDADGMHKGSVNGILFRLTAPISGTVKIPITFYGGGSFYNEIGTADIVFSTDPSPSSESESNDSDDTENDDVDSNDYKLSLDEDSVVSYTVTPQDGYDGYWSALLYKGTPSSDKNPELFYDGEYGEKSERVVLKAGDYTLSFIGDDSTARFDFTESISPVDMGSPSVKSVSTKKSSSNKVKYSSVTIKGDTYDTDGYRVTIAKKKNMTGTIINTVKKVSNSGKVTINTTKKISGKYAYVTVTPYVSDFYGNKIWGDESDAKKIALPKVTKKKAPKGYYTYTNSKYGYTVYVPNWMKKSKKISGGYTFKGKGITMRLYGKKTGYRSVTSYVNTGMAGDAKVSGNTYIMYDNMNDTWVDDFGYWVKGSNGAAIFCEVSVPPTKNYNDWKKVHTKVYNSIKKNTNSNIKF